MLAPLQYVEHNRRRTALVVIAVVAAVVALAVVLLTRRGTATVLVSPGPPYPASAPAGPVAESLPEQDGPHSGQEWTPWTLLAVSPDGRVITVGWNNERSPGCSGPPVAAHVEQNDQAVRIGLITRSGTDRLCAGVGLSSSYRIALAEPIDSEAIYRLGV